MLDLTHKQVPLGQRFGAFSPRLSVLAGLVLLLLCGATGSAYAQTPADNLEAVDAPLPLTPVAPKPNLKPKSVVRPSAKPATKVASPTPLRANPQEPTLLQRAHIAAPHQQMPDFVRQSRPPEAQINYVPISQAPGEPSSTPMKADEIRAQEAALDAIRLKHDKITKRTPAPLATKSVAGGPLVVPAKPKTP